NPYAGLVSHLRASWLSGKTRPMEYRVAQLEALGRFLDERKEDILEATARDMGKPSFEAYFSEILLCKNELNNTLNNLSCWMKDEHVDKSLVMQLDAAFIRKDPYGLVLIIAPWNYPIHLFLVPLIGAIAAGNCVIIKPSETSKHTERLVAEVLPCYLDNDCFAVVTAGVEETTKLLENKFDYIFFTGTPSVGKIIMTAAAKHLTPVTLELGGKNPCYVSDTCDVENVARRVAWGRFFNAGQTCIAPDYVLCTHHQNAYPSLESLLEVTWRSFWVQRQSFSSLGTTGIVFQVKRELCPAVALSRAEHRNTGNLRQCFPRILPNLLVSSLEYSLGEISVFCCPCSGALLPVLTPWVRAGAEPWDKFRPVFCVAGNSGLGKYHGKFTFDTFSHHRGCLHRTMGLEALNGPRYPPYTQQKLGLLSAAFEIKRKGMCTLL
ncbi:AL3B2 dehydrogenase, partial [Pterocles burchelli]|nr:AL3B2 dehydrogenase [Pterocles burchelli]